ncbi:MAG: hypothetical protein OXR66_06690 [Candidatus Woesearchaeota archaeon]|nr:hypothetical protein [Candidatus Woesearchaeota archaeon]
MNLDDAIERTRFLPTLVEGPNDKKALEKLGFTTIIVMQGPLYAIVEQIQHHEELALLVDLDAYGKKLYRYFYTELTKRGVKVNNEFRELLFSTPVRQIEGLVTYLEKVEA